VNIIRSAFSLNSPSYLDLSASQCSPGPLLGGVVLSVGLAADHAGFEKGVCGSSLYLQQEPGISE